MNNRSPFLVIYFLQIAYLVLYCMSRFLYFPGRVKSLRQRKWNFTGVVIHLLCGIGAVLGTASTNVQLLQIVLEMRIEMEI